jgi:hypothetical protein
MLNEMRLGKISEETVRAFRKLNRKATFEDSIEGTELQVMLLFSSAHLLIRVQLPNQK